AEPIVARSFREFVMTVLLLHQPHSYTDALARLGRPVTPRDVKRAIDYIEANLDTAIGLPETVAACGVPGRTLIKPLHDFKGTPPMRYRRGARYQRVREALSRAEPEEKVGDIAAKWGFSHMVPPVRSASFRRWARSASAAGCRDTTGKRIWSFMAAPTHT